MKKYEEKKFNIGELKGISAKNIEEHLKLYAGYVKNTNLVLEKITEYMSEPEKNAYVLGELGRRFSFEWNGMRNHEYYFESLEGGAKELPENSKLKEKLTEQFGSFSAFMNNFKNLTMTRGIGWAVLCYDKKIKELTLSWIDEQHMGQLNGLSWVLGIDMWEHAYLYDYASSEKKKYIEVFFENLNWAVIEENFLKAL